MDTRPSETDYAYLAGIIDGEGCINAYPNGRSNPVPRLTVSMTDAVVIEWLVMFGGSMRLESSRTSGKPIWRWTATANPLRVLLPRCLPYLKAKKGQAELLLELLALQQYGPGYSYAGGNQPKRQAEICQELKNLKGTTH